MALKREDWSAVVDEHLTGVYRFVGCRVPAQAVDDLVQEVFASAGSNVEQYDRRRGSIWQWIIGIARNRIAQYYRETQTRPAVESLTWLAGEGDVQRAIMAEHPLPDEICEREEFRALARLALSALEPRHRDCLVARYYEDLSLARLAQRLNLSPSAANSLLFRARRELRNVLLGLMDEATHRRNMGND